MSGHRTHSRTFPRLITGPTRPLDKIACISSTLNAAASRSYRLTGALGEICKLLTFDCEVDHGFVALCSRTPGRFIH